MTQIRAAAFTISADGFGAGPDQNLEAPLGQGGEELHGWFTPTSTFRRMMGKEGGSEGVNESFAQRSMEGLGAWVMGRNMFGPIRGDWPDDSWRGWWGETPPYRCDVFVLTHHPRAPLEMEGGTVFHFVTDGLAAAVERARESAKGRDVRIGGGVATLREAFRLRLIDAAHIAVAPVLLGRGESLFEGTDLRELGYRVARGTPADGALHLEIERAA